ncbi:MAG: exported protein of unknown function [Candidatus Thorarchaeota archaeon]|nr:MAG: exported protein of unknown function [Candidatus Thorarchaeota archaeon]
MNKIPNIVLFLSLLCCILFCSTSDVSAGTVDFYERGDTLSFGVYLLQNGTYGDPVSHQKIEFYDETENKLLDVDITDEYGFASIQWTIPLSHVLGPITLNATFDGNASEYLSPSVQFYYFDLYSSINIDVNGNKEIIAPTDSLKINASLYDDSEIAVEGMNVSIYSDALLLDSVLSDEDGLVFFEFECNLDYFSLGNNLLKIEVAADPSRYFSSCITYYEFTIEKVETLIESNFSNSTIFESNSTSELCFQLLSTESPLNGVPMDLFIDGELWGTYTTNDLGFVNITIAFDASFILFNHTIIVSFEGTERYTSAIRTFSITLLCPFEVNVSTSSCVVGDMAVFNITVLDIFNRSVDNLLAWIYDSSVQETYLPSVMDECCSIIFEFRVGGFKGNRNFILNINNQFVNENHTFFVTIWSQPSITLVESSVNHFASPGQEIYLLCRLDNHSASLKDSVLYVLRNDIVEFYNITNDSGVVGFSISCPNEEGEYLYVLSYLGNNSILELSSTLNYSIYISRQIPLLVILIDQTINCPLQQMNLEIQVSGYNGILAQSIRFEYEWINNHGSESSDIQGNVFLVLPVPSDPGEYLLDYYIESTNEFMGRNGSICVYVSTEEALASQGIGLSGILLSSSVSVTLISLPIIRRYYLLS